MFSRALFVGAHVDDIELFAGGTAARFSDGATFLVFSSHKGPLTTQSPPKEAQRAADFLGVKNLILRDLNAVDGTFQRERGFIARELERCRVMKPSVVVTHQSTDTNQDHKQVYEEVLRVFKGRCSIICGTFPNNDVPPARRRLYVKLSSKNVKMKLQALACYTSQRKEGRHYFALEVLVGQVRFWGGCIHTQYAEVFEVIQLQL